MTSYVALVQGLYFLLTGLWPLFSIGTFQQVTGPKTDRWLVKTVGVVIAVIGLGLLVGGWRAQITLELALIAVGSAAGLMGIDIIYVSKRVIAPIYLLDAAAELLLILAWVFSWWLERGVNG